MTPRFWMPLTVNGKPTGGVIESLDGPYDDIRDALRAARQQLEEYILEQAQASS